MCAKCILHAFVSACVFVRYTMWVYYVGGAQNTLCNTYTHEFTVTHFISTLSRHKLSTSYPTSYCAFCLLQHRIAGFYVCACVCVCVGARSYLHKCLVKNMINGVLCENLLSCLHFKHY